MQAHRKFLIAIEENLLTLAIAALIFLMYAPLIIYWYDGWFNKSISIEHEYFSHGVIGLPFAGYIIFCNCVMKMGISLIPLVHKCPWVLFSLNLQSLFSSAVRI